MAATRTIRIPLTQPQVVEVTVAQVWEGSDADAATIILAHGAGTTLSHRHMQRHAIDLQALGHNVVLFNFAYSQDGRKRPDPGPRLEQAWRDVIPAVREDVQPRGALVIGGRSMGGRIATMVAAEDGAGLGVAGVASIAYPLHPPGRPTSLRVTHWPSLQVPVILVCGDRDSMAPVETLQEQVDAHMPSGIATLRLIAGADHSFRVRKADGRTEDEVFAEAAGAISAWCAAL